MQTKCKRPAWNKKTTEQYKADLFAKWGDQIQVLGEYTGNKIPTLHRGECGHEWMGMPNNILRGAGCYECKIINNGKKRATSHDQYLLRVKEIHGDKIIVVGEYVRSQVEIEHRCECGLTWMARPNNIIMGAGCPECSRLAGHEAKRTTDSEYLDLLKESLVTIRPIEPINGMNVKSLHRCPDGHEWACRPSDVIHGHGCPQCQTISRGEKILRQILEAKGIPFREQVRFDDLRGVGGNPLSYDFQLGTTLIEVQGIQHFEPVDRFGGQQQFDRQQEHDQRKRDYAKAHGYDLLEVDARHSHIKDLKARLEALPIFGQEVSA